MAIVKVEPSGCCVHKGMVQVRFSFYLKPTDPRYDEHHIQVPVIPEGGYPGKVGYASHYGLTVPLDMEDYHKWFNALPMVWQNNPFHNHFIYVDPNTTDKEIMDIGETFLQEAFGKWAGKKNLDLKNKPVKFLEFVGSKRLKACEAKVKHLKANVLERKV